MSYKRSFAALPIALGESPKCSNDPFARARTKQESKPIAQLRKLTRSTGYIVLHMLRRISQFVENSSH